jgi:hypothetical protein
MKIYIIEYNDFDDEWTIRGFPDADVNHPIGVVKFGQNYTPAERLPMNWYNVWIKSNNVIWAFMDGAMLINEKFNKKEVVANEESS